MAASGTASPDLNAAEFFPAVLACLMHVFNHVEHRLGSYAIGDEFRII